MSLAIVYSRAQTGMHAPLVTVETHLSNGLPSFSIVGLPEAAVKESRDRVRSALLNSRFEFPIQRITVNLAPADLPKEGGRFDLPIAIGILAASQQIPHHTLHEYEFAGELALSGELRPIRGMLPLAIATHRSQKKLVIPRQNADEASLIQDIDVFPAQHILEVCAHFCDQEKIMPYEKKTKRQLQKFSEDLSEVHGQKVAKRALEIAASGEHSILLVGPPGTGKTMIAARLPTILPSMTEEEAIDSAAITSISHHQFEMKTFGIRPFRAPHHSASSVALVGGGNPPRPGEISLAHRGILFLDELSEFNRHVLETLREPLESGTIVISRAARQCKFPASFQLIATMNPCPCGHLGDPENACRCSLEQIQRYQAKISGPILDRIDIHIEVPRIPTDALSFSKNKNEKSLVIRQRVEKAREKQIKRCGKTNAKLSIQELSHYCKLHHEQEKFLNHAIQTLHLSARSYHRVIKVAKTIADLANSERIEQSHLAEAFNLHRFAK